MAAVTAPPATTTLETRPPGNGGSDVLKVNMRSANPHLPARSHRQRVTPSSGRRMFNEKVIDDLVEKVWFFDMRAVRATWQDTEHRTRDILPKHD